LKGLTRGNVLIVEDDSVAREAMAKIVQAEGYRAVAVATVAEAVGRLDGQAFAILDLNLPDGLGTYILRRIRDEGRTTRTAVVSGTTDAALLRWASRYGAELVLPKPLAVEPLLQWLAQPCGASSSSPPASAAETQHV
jgi:CheY-like chemotaxis protein